jgi:hypothetical protein
MITVFLRGGLGNQMFQYALGLNLAKKNKTALVLDTTFLNDRFPRPQFTYRTYDLDVFDVAPRFTALSKISRNIPIPGVWLGLDLGLMGARDVFGIQKMIIEDERAGTVFDPNVLAVGSRALLYGRWGSEKYFADAADDVRAAFHFRHPLEGEAKILAENIQSCNSVSLHVRRGDYLLPKYKKEYGQTDMSYYDRAVKYVAERVSNSTVFVFSDDVAWCRENIKPTFPTVYVDDASRGPKAAFHLELMSLCKHNIISNSSFSWWAAWLNQNPSKIIVAPREWYVGVEHDDIVPEGWARM